MKIINDNNFSIEDYEEALIYLYSLLDRPDISKNFEELCLQDINDINNILITLTSTKSISMGKPRRNKRERQKKEYNKKKKIYEETKHGYPSSVYKHEDGSLRRFYFAEGAKRSYKKISNKKFRKNSNKLLRTFGTCEVPRGNKYRRIFDYWWEIF